MRHTTPTLIDAHFHLDLHPKPAELAANMQSRGIKAIAVTNAPSVFHYTYQLSQKYDAILPAVGLHPELALERREELPVLRDWLRKTRFVGEVGLDYVTKDQRNRNVQRSVFQSILSACAEFGDKIVTVHSRRSSSDVIAAIGDNYPGRIILHWYSGSVRDLEKAIEYGFYFSVNYAMLESRRGCDLIRRVPYERILIETDGPFVNVGSAPATSLHLPEILRSLANLMGEEKTSTAERIARNFSALLSDRQSGALQNR